MNELLDPHASSLSQWLIGLVVAIPSGFVIVQKMLKGWSSDRADRVAHDANTSITVGHVEEIERLQKLNKYLSDELTNMQVTVTKLVGDNQTLQNEIAALQTRLQQVLAASAAR